MENKFSGNYFQLTGCFEGFDPEMVWSENFHFKSFPDSRTEIETETEREILRLWLCRLRRSQPSTSTSLITPSTSPIYKPTFGATNRSLTQSLRPTNLRLHRRPKAFALWIDLQTRAFDPEPRTHEPISLSVWFWFSMWFWSTHEPTSLWSLIFLLLLWWDFGGFPVMWWWKIAFSECFQIHKNIF